MCVLDQNRSDDLCQLAMDTGNDCIHLSVMYLARKFKINIHDMLKNIWGREKWEYDEEVGEKDALDARCDESCDS